MAALRYAGNMAEHMVKLGTNGRFVLPAHIRRVLGVADGGTLVVRLVDDEVRLSTPQAAVRRAQRAVRPFLRTGRSLADELIIERRADEGRE